MRDAHNATKHSSFLPVVQQILFPWEEQTVRLILVLPAIT